MLSIDALVSRQNHVRPADDLELNAILASVLTASFEGMFRVRDRIENADANALDPVRDYIRVHYSEDLSLRTLSQMAGMTPNYFSRRFKQFFGRTPIDYQLDLRMRHACVLLKTADLKLSDVAAAVGFDDVYYFSRLFKRRVGIAPGR